MGTLAIRQGDVLYFARSLVWKVTMSESNDRIEWSRCFARMVKVWSTLTSTQIAIL